MAGAQKYNGGCHCGKVRFEVTADLTRGAMECNCSLCSKTGNLGAFAPADQFKLLSGADSLSDYQFAKKSIHHLFCRICGVRSFSRGVTPDGREMCGINVRCLDGVDISHLNINQFDGRSL
ncbi:MAG: GFA family protein [Candidatus Binataceae bacterium]